MKKLMSFVVVAALGIVAAFAQTGTPASKSQEKTVKTVKKETKADGTKQQAKKVEEKTTSTKHLKADGTPDKRYKENKTSEGPKKKDGTADMRYKVNKEKAKKK